MNFPFSTKIASIILIVSIITSCKQNHTGNKKELYTSNSKTEKLSTFIQEALNLNPIIPALSIAVVDESGPVFIKTYGYADYINQIKANENTNFYIASCTKSFNGLLANILEEEGKIDLEKSITEYKPFKDFKDKTVFENVSIMDLLSHQSGLENPYLTFRLAYSGQYKNDEILRLIEEDTRKSDLGKGFSYTNLGYYLFDVLIKAELGESWKKLLQEKVFDSLNMEFTSAAIPKIKLQHLALPHLGAYKDSIYYAKLIKTNQTMHAAGGIVSNARDISKFLSFYINSGYLNNKKIYSEELVKKTYKKQVSTGNKIGKAYNCHGYTAGWLQGKINSENLILHYGAYEGFRSHISFIPEKKIGVAVFINHEYAMPFINQIVKYTYNLYLGNEENIKNLEQAQKQELSELLSGYQNWISEREQKMINNSWENTLPKSDYTGTYYNNKMGTLVVSIKKDKLITSCGNLVSIAIPHKDKDCIWVKMSSQSGETICFNLENKKVKSLHYKDNTFIKKE